MERSFPARLHALLAADTPDAVIIRRGPARRVCTVGWDRAEDTFEAGQWLHGRIYERRCDLSADGRRLVYFAYAFGRRPNVRGPYTAVSRAPWLKALSLWPKNDHWEGGGLFTSEGDLWLNGCHDEPVRTQRDLRLSAAPPIGGRYGGECPGVYYRRLQRDGWTLETREPGLATFEKPIQDGWLLRKFAVEEITDEEGHGPYFDEHQLERVGTGDVVDLPGWEWVEHDAPRDRLVFAREGVLHEVRLTPAGLGEPRALHDFNAMAPEPLAAPY